MRVKIPGDFGAGGLILDEAFTAQQSRYYNSPGHFWCWVLGDGTPSVGQADPVVWITGELLAYIHWGFSHAAVSLRCTEKRLDTGQPDWYVAAGVAGATLPCGFLGDSIRIETAERPCIYVVTQCISEADHVWEARWPD